MSFIKLKNSTFKNAAVGVATLTASALPFTIHAADNSACAPLQHTSSGSELDAGTSAHVYSQEHMGSVGISIFPGQDLGNHSPHELGTKLVQVMKLNGVDAECFVHSKSGNHGTAVNFHIGGLSWKKDGFLNISQSLDKKTLRGVIAEATLTKELLASKTSPIAQVN